MPVGPSGLELRLQELQLKLVLGLFDIPAEIELGPRKADDAVEAGLHFRREIPPSHKALRFLANRIQGLHEISLFQLAGIVWHERSESGCGYLGTLDVGFSRSTNLASSFPICRSQTISSGILSGGRTAFESVKTRVILMTRPSCTYSDR
jgi:hypothetical protein